MASNVQILDDALTPLAAVPVFDVVPGARSNVVTFHIVNNHGGSGADTAHDLALRVMERTPGESTWHASGRPLVDGRRVEVRLDTFVTRIRPDAVDLADRKDAARPMFDAVLVPDHHDEIAGVQVDRPRFDIEIPQRGRCQR